MADRRYTKSHEWVSVDGDIAAFGISDHAQHELGDIVHVEAPDAGTAVQAGSPFGSVESVKAASDIYAPMSGEVVEVNDKLADAPELLNKDAHGEGWIVKVRISKPAELNQLLTEEQYQKLISE
ncbi:MAG: glycine cleavage system protein GcvH [Candidatus Brocadiia bacterium]